jgi:glutamate--cysteine ligase
MQGVSELMDGYHNTFKYTDVLRKYSEMVDHPEMTPSACMLEDMRENKEGFFQFANRMSHAHQQYFSELPEDKEKYDLFSKLSVSSIEEQREIEKADTLSFDEYLENYFKQEL